MKHFFINSLIVGISALIFTSCKIEKDLLPTEPVKNFVGTWKLTKVLRNDEDITAYVDSTGFRFTLNQDNSFLIQKNNIPFLANASGTWLLDDPAYVFHISLKENDMPTSFSADLSAPVQNGKRNMIISFSPGCIANKYVYTLETIQ